MASGICYILTNRPRGVLYTGVTTDLGRRVWEHREGTVEGFTSRYGLTRLVHYEEFPLFMDAVQREKNIKHWRRAWKIELIERSNPEWRDLFDTLWWDDPRVEREDDERRGASNFFLADPNFLQNWTLTFSALAAIPAP